MTTGFYTRLAASGIRKNTRLYIPRILAEAGLLGCFYILVTLAADQRLEGALGGSYLPTFMAFGAVVIGLLSFILILYVNSFLMKRRKSEYGLYNVLGMEKRHIIRVLFAESLITSLLSIVLGLLFRMKHNAVGLASIAILATGVLVMISTTVSMGGDDFIAKPVEPMVLCAKIQAVLRRSYEMNGVAGVIEFCGAALHLNDGSVSIGGETHDLVIREYSLDELIRGSVRRLAAQFVEKRLRLCYTPTDATVVTDQKWFSFILDQLLSNAVKYTPSGTITIEMRGRLLRISDTGPGITPEDLPRIFEKGYTGVNGRLGQRSSGLGLYLSKKAADMLSIPLSAESAVGAGSVFILDLRQC